MHVSAIEAHRRWAPSYDANPNPLLSLEHRLLADVAPKTLLDIACGTGRWMLYFAERGATVIGVDACKEMLAKALEKPPLHGRVTLADAAALPFAAACADLTLCSFAAGYFPDLRPPCKKWRESLAQVAKSSSATYTLQPSPPVGPDPFAMGTPSTPSLLTTARSMKHSPPPAEPDFASTEW